MLARIWNLSEGLRREPGWVGGYVLARASELKSSTTPELFLTNILGPLMQPTATPRWEGPFRVSTLSLRSADEEFLPGDQELVAPSVLVIADRRRPVRIGVHLKKAGHSEILGLFGASETYTAACANPEVVWNEDHLLVGPEIVRMPFLRKPFRWSIVPTGFVVASSQDSQRLWIAETHA